MYIKKTYFEITEHNKGLLHVLFLFFTVLPRRKAGPARAALGGAGIVLQKNFELKKGEILF